MKNKKDTNKLIAKLFKSVVAKSKIKEAYRKSKSRELNELSLKAFQNGIIITDETLYYAAAPAHQLVNELIEIHGINVNNANSTLFKTFNDVKSISDEGFYFNQYLHYLAGLFELDYRPHDGLSDIELDRLKYMFKEYDFEALKNTYESFVKIELISEEALATKVENLLYSGVALNSELIIELIDLISIYNISIDYNKVKNKEFMSVAYINKIAVPKDLSELMRAIWFKYLDSPLLIKNKENLEKLKMLNMSQADEITNLFKSYVYVNGDTYLASEIMRYKKEILLIRQAASDKKFYNKIFKLAKKVETKKLPNNLSNISNTLDVNYIDKLNDDNTNIYQLVKAYNALINNSSITDLENNPNKKLYRIRNGKVWIGDITKTYTQVEREKALFIASKIKKLIINKLKHLAGKSIYLPYNFAIPTSTKSFIGDAIPEFTVLDFSSAMKFGIYWDFDADLDMHATSIDGNHVGWNGSYRNGDLLYSGDVVRLNSDNYAAEFFKFNDSINYGDDTYYLIESRPYSIRSNEGSSSFIIARDSGDDFGMVSPKDIVFNTKYEGRKSSSVALIKKSGDSLYVYLLNLNALKVSQITNSEDSINIINSLVSLTENALTIKSILEEVGANIITNKGVLDYFTNQGDILDYDLSLNGLTSEKVISLLENK